MTYIKSDGLQRPDNRRDRWNERHRPEPHLDAFIRNEMCEAGYSYPHHSGHGVGVYFHEEPRIVPAATMPLKPGMVIALESTGFSIRIGAHVEHMIQITEGGALVLTDYNLILN